ncbi:SpoIIE family protein phosphatase [Leptospira sp. 96542]|nr:SpoIIE family protein phosphatase [Leptospira sp. 96542]
MAKVWGKQTLFPMSSRTPGFGHYQHLESFIHLSLDPIWCYELDSPMPTTLPLSEQVRFLYEHSLVRECNEATAKLYGLESISQMKGKLIKDLIPLGDFSPIYQFVNASYRLENLEYEEVLTDGRRRFFLLNVIGQVENGFLIRSWGQQKEITSIREAESRMGGLLKFSQLVSEISKTFVMSKAEFISDAIHFAIEELGKFALADRVFVAEISADKKSLSVTHEWLDEGIPSLYSAGTKLPISKMNPERLGVLASAEGMVHIADTSLEEGDWQKQLFQSAQVKSLLVMGLRDEGNLVGIIGITTYEKIGIWSDETKQMLGFVSGLVSQGLVRAKNEIKLKIKEKILQRFYSDVKEDLALAKLTQDAWVTTDFGNYPGVKIESRFLPYDEIGGDLILCERPSEDCIDIFFGDISGHGISSALVSGIVAVTFKKYSKPNLSPKEILASIHNELKTVIFKHHLSACMLRIFPNKKEVVFSFAGHPPAVTWNEESEDLGLIKDEMYPILLLDEWEGNDISHSFKKGDRLLLYSDGIYELEEPGVGYLGLDLFLSELKSFVSDAGSNKDLLKKLITNCLIDKERIVHDDIAILMIEF